MKGSPILVVYEREILIESRYRLTVRIARYDYNHRPMIGLKDIQGESNGFGWQHDRGALGTRWEEELTLDRAIEWVMETLYSIHSEWEHIIYNLFLLEGNEPKIITRLYYGE